jgi:hypothetical protein
MNVVDALKKADTSGSPDAAKLQTGGNTYLKASFPQLDYIKSATLL